MSITHISPQHLTCQPWAAIRTLPLEEDGLFEDWVCGSAWGRRIASVVCDGAGGMRHAERASRRCAELFLDLCRPEDSGGSPVPGLRRVQLALSREISRLQAELGERRMATTLTGICTQGDLLRLYHVGDSQAHLLRAGRCTLLSHDHHVDDRSSDMLGRALGNPHRDQLESLDLQLEPGDRILLSTDGLSSTGLLPADLAALLEDHDVRTFADAVLREIKLRQPSDQVSLIVVQPDMLRDE